MARVTVSVSISAGDYEVEIPFPEVNHQAWGSQRDYVDNVLDEAVRRIKRAYNAEPDRDVFDRNRAVIQDAIDNPPRSGFVPFEATDRD